jgi:prolyl-tRNA editing enzyme YbaK/EbsC (Cys-tRNA(Pro) deacylase)
MRLVVRLGARGHPPEIGSDARPRRSAPAPPILGPMSDAPIGDFAEAWPAAERPDLLAAPVAAAIASVEGAFVVDTDPEVADTAAFCERYGVTMEQSANCVVVAAKRGGETTLAACVVLAHTRADVNGVLRRHLGARKASFAPREAAVAESGMEFGGITPIGLPQTWPLLLDRAVLDVPWAVIGSGVRRSKILVPGKTLSELPGAEIIEGLAG